MRRKDREVTDIEKIKSIIQECKICRIGFYDGNEVYIVPLNFGFDSKHMRLYFHGAKAGRKFDLIKDCPKVAFEMENGYQLYGDGNIACTYSARFECVMGQGKIFIVESQQEQEKALLMIMKHQTGKDDFQFNSAMLNSVAVYCLDIETVTAKIHE